MATKQQVPKPDIDVRRFDELAKAAGLTAAEIRAADPNRPANEPYPDELERQARSATRAAQGVTTKPPEPPPAPEPEPPPEPEPEDWLDQLDRFMRRGRESPFTSVNAITEETAPISEEPEGPAGAVITGINRVLSPERPVGRLATRIGRLPTPGGLPAVIAILLVLFFALVPVNGGVTRLEMFWRSLTGGVAVPKDALGMQLDAEWQAAAQAETTTQNTLIEKGIHGAEEGAFWQLLPGQTVPLPAEWWQLGGTGLDGAAGNHPASLLN